MGEADTSPSLLDRIHSWAKTHASDRIPSDTHGPTLPTSNPSVLPTAAYNNVEKQSLKRNVDPSPSSSNGPPDIKSSTLPPPAPPPQDNKEQDGQSSTLTTSEKPGWPARAKAGSRRFVNHTKDALLHSWVNVLLVFVPVGIAVKWAPIDESVKPTIVFAMNAIAIIPLAGLLSHATESVASRMGDTLASLLNVTFGNAVELIIFILALVKNQITIVQASILGSILANLLLILGMAFLLGGLRYREQIYNSTVTQMSAVLLSLSVTSLLLPTAFHESFSNNDSADTQTIKISRGTSIVLLLVYVLYLLFQLKSHAYMYESTPQRVIDEESHPGVLADIMNSSSSDSSDSSSSSDTDSSAGSHRTAKSRIKRAFRHKKRTKSNASSATGPSSAMSSPSTEMRSLPDNTSTEKSYFNAGRNRRGTNASTTLSGDEADTDGEHQTRVRDFETEQEKATTSVPTSHRRHKKHKKKSKKRKHEKEPESTLTGVASSSNAGDADSNHSHRVGFAEPVESHAEAPAAPPRRPFAITRASFRPPLPSVFTNTVFSTPPPDVQTPQGQHVPGALSIARGPQLRRTNSLPDRLHRPGLVVSNDTPHRVGKAAMNEAYALEKQNSEIGPQHMSRTAAVMLLLISTGLVAFCAELLVDAIPEMIESTSVSEAFIGLIVLPIVGNAAEHVTAVAVALKNKMDLAIGIAVGSSIQIALFITPVVVIIGWILDKNMSLYFNLFETVSLFVTAFVVNFLVLDGRSNYLEGSLLIAAYVIIALVAYYYPASADQSLLGGA